MFDLTVTRIVCLCSILVVNASKCPKYPPYEPRYKYPLVNDKPFPYPTYVPIQLETKKCCPATLPPLILTIYEDDILVAHNAENKLYFAVLNSTAKVATLTGGPMFNKTYQLCNLNFGWDNTALNTHGWRLQDGKGCQLEMQVEFFRQDLGSRLPATLHRDGLVDINVPVCVHQGKVENPKFYNWQKCVEGVKENNSTYNIRAGDILPFVFEQLTCGHPYYCFPGARPDEYGKALFSANIISGSVDCPGWISASQFQVFLDLKSVFNQTIPKTSSLFDMGERPCVQTASEVVVRKRCSSYY